MRLNNRAADSLRSVSVEWNIQPSADSSLLIRSGNTHVICGISIEEKVPPFLKGSGSGWITAEYGMLPCATSSRYKREGTSGKSGRTHEIQRLIGRSLRMMVDLALLGERTLRVDCDVLNADGGTRTASITGAALALQSALVKMVADGRLAVMPEIMPIAAISVGIVGGVPLLDLDYAEDSQAEADANFVMSGEGHWIEIQSTAEGAPFSNDSFLHMTSLARKGIHELLSLWPEKVSLGSEKGLS
ncbi:MAG: ribonuclease PH [Desulfobulbaceae bacterium]